MTLRLPSKAWDVFSTNIATSLFTKELIDQITTTGLFPIKFHELTHLFNEYALQAATDCLEDHEFFIKMAENTINEVFNIIANSEKKLRTIKINLEYPQLELTPISLVRQEHLDKPINIEGIITMKSDIEIVGLKAHYQCTNEDCNHHSTRGREPTRDLRPTIRCEKCDKIMEKTHNEASDQLVIYLDEPYTEGTELKRIVVLLRDQYIHPIIEKRLTHGTRIRVFGKIDAYKTKKTLIYCIIPTGLTILGDDLELVKPTAADQQKLLEMKKSTSLITHFRQKIFANIIGNDEFLESVIVSSIGAPAKNDGIDYQRGDPNLLVIGDRGTGKSKALSIITNLIPKARMVSAGTTSTPGMTATTIRDELTGQYMLYPGAILLASGSVLCIDEGGRMDKETLNALHSTIESGKLPVNKGGYNRYIPCQTTIMVTSNPPGGAWNRTKPYSEQLIFDTSFMDRFDSLFCQTDTADETTDGQIYDSGTNPHKIPLEEAQFFRKYWLIARRTQTILSPEAAAVGREFYLKYRSITTLSGIPSISARTAMGIQRLAIAHARAELKEIADATDMNWAIKIYTLGRLPLLQHDGQISYTETNIDDKSKNPSTVKEAILNYLQNYPDQTSKQILDHLTTIPVLRHVTMRDLDQQIQKLKHFGDIHEPRPDQWRLLT